MSSKRIPAGQFFLLRLERLVRLRYEYRGDVNAIGIRMLDQAIVATSGDATDYGCGLEADMLVNQMTARLEAAE